MIFFEYLHYFCVVHPTQYQCDKIIFTYNDTFKCYTSYITQIRYAESMCKITTLLPMRIYNISNNTIY